ncbi:hypothetical protein M422DRAFT_243846 [Sphaerobolus stellatus SS14]|nr:hypothetical protein M422DRAFT_243846 [Sphaerobolus stellatus SS14]
MVDSWKDDILLKGLTSNIYTTAAAVTSPSVYYWGKQTYFTPVPWTFGIWYSIHLLLFGFVVYQFFPAGKRIIIDGIGWRFPILGVFTTIYINVWAHQHYIAAFVFALLVSITVSYIYYILKKNYASENFQDELWVHLPFSIYQAWTTVLVILSAFEAFGLNARTTRLNVLNGTLVFLGLLFLETSSAAYAISRPEGDLATSSVITLAFFGIFNNKRDMLIMSPALTFGVVSFYWIIKSLYGHFIRYRSKRGGAIQLSDEETA